jgi:hypothetical protein
VKIPWPLPPAVDGSTHHVGRSRAAARGCGLETRHGGAGRAPPRSRSTAARPPIGGRTRRREGPWRCHPPPRRSSTDERHRLDLLDARVRLCRGVARQRRVHPSDETAPSRGELQSAKRREEAQMNPRVHTRAPTSFLFGRNPRVAVGCRWTAHV